MRILSISTSDKGGGAERFANDLNQSFRMAGHFVSEFVGIKKDNSSHHQLITDQKKQSSIKSIYDRIEGVIPSNIVNQRGIRRGFYYLRTASRGINAIQHEFGHQGLYYPASWKLIDQCNHKPDILVAHNLHGNYFDLRALTFYSRSMPVFWVLHDEWAYTGRCAHSQNCQGWKQSCGVCPDLTTYVAFPRDGSERNLATKKKIYQKSNFYIITPSEWIGSRVKDSILASATNEVRVIPYGIDQEIFFPGCQSMARRSLQIDPDCFVITFIAVNARNNVWKDYQTFEAAVRQVAQNNPERKIRFFVLGDNHSPIIYQNSRIEFVSAIGDKLKIKDYLIASDVYLHSAKVDNFPLAILEALSCGLPVIASAVGGIPEQVLGYKKYHAELSACNNSPVESATGLLVDCGSPQQQARAIEILMFDPKLRAVFSANSQRDAKRRFNLSRQMQLYVEWFHQVVDQRRSGI